MASGKRGESPTNTIKAVVALCTVLAVVILAVILLWPELAEKLAAIALLLVGLLAALFFELHDGRIAVCRRSGRADPPVDP